MLKLRDYFHSESKVYAHLCPEKRKARVTELWVGVGFCLFSTVAIVFAFLMRAIHENPQFFRALQE